MLATSSKYIWYVYNYIIKLNDVIIYIVIFCEYMESIVSTISSTSQNENWYITIMLVPQGSLYECFQSILSLDLKHYMIIMMQCGKAHCTGILLFEPKCSNLYLGHL